MKQFQALITQEWKYFIAQNIELWVVSQGLSLEEAVDNLREATQLYIEDSHDYDKTYTSQAFLTTITV